MFVGLLSLGLTSGRFGVGQRLVLGLLQGSLRLLSGTLRVGIRLVLQLLQRRLEAAIG